MLYRGAQTQTQAGQRHIPYHMMSCSIDKLELARGQIALFGKERTISAVNDEQLHCGSLVLYIL